MVDIQHTWDKELRKMVTVKTGGHVRHEYAMMTLFDIPQIMKPWELRGDSLILPYFPERSADGVAGYCTERLAWKFLHDVATALVHIHSKGYVHNDISLSGILIGNEGFILGNFSACTETSVHGCTDADDIWSLGAAVFQLLMGMEVFNGKGRKEQKTDTMIPVLRKDMYSSELSDIIARCLDFNVNERPSADVIAAEAAGMMQRKKDSISSDTPLRSDVEIPYEDIWPEAMIK